MDEEYLDYDTYQDCLALGGADTLMDFPEYLRQFHSFYLTSHETE